MIIVYPKGNVPAGSLMVTSFKPIKAFGSNYTHSTLDSFLLSHTINKPQSMVRHNKKGSCITFILCNDTRRCLISKQKPLICVLGAQTIKPGIYELCSILCETSFHYVEQETHWLLPTDTHMQQCIFMSSE